MKQLRNQSISGKYLECKGAKLKRILSILFISIITISLIASLVGCSSKTTSTVASNTTTQIPVQIIKVGIVTTLTGPGAAFGLGVQHGVELALDDVNNAGGIVIKGVAYKFQTIVYDDKYDTTTGTDAARTAIYQDGVKFLFGPLFSGAADAVAPLCAQAKVLQFVTAYDNLWMTPTDTYTYRPVIPGDMKTNAFYGYILKTYPNVKKAAHISTNDSTGQTQTAAEDAILQANGVTITDEIYYASGTTDFMPFLNRMLSKNPDIIDCGGMPPGDAALFCKQARSLGYKGLMTDISPCSAVDMMRVASQADLEGFLSTQIALQAPLVSQTILDLPGREKAKYGTAYGVTWTNWGAGNIFTQLIQRAGSVDPTDVKKVLDDSSQVFDYPAFTGVSKAVWGGPVAESYYPGYGSHQIVIPYVISMIQNGQDTNAQLVTPVPKPK